MNGVEAEGGPVPTSGFDLALGLRWAALGVAALAALPGFFQLGFVWSTSDYLAHGYVIPAVTCVLLFGRRAQIAQAVRDARPPRSGPFFVLLAAAIESAGVLAEAGTIAGLGIPALLAATAFAVGGMPLLRLVALPVSFLLFMVPPPSTLQDRVLVQLKAFVIEAAATVLRIAGFSIATSGNRILVPGHDLFVADACSGLVSITTLLPLGAVVAYFLSHGVWRRALVVASIVPLAMLGNLVRVVLTVVLVSRYGLAYAEGLLHESAGLVTFAAGSIALVLIARVLR